MKPARVMVVDDSSVIRRLISNTLDEHDLIEVVASAPNGQAALDVVASEEIDAIVLDIEMPVMDGVTTVRELRRSGKWMPVIMFSTLTERGARITFDALAAGASDYVCKPANSNSISESRENVRLQLVPRILALTGLSPFAVPGTEATQRRLPPIGSRPDAEPAAAAPTPPSIPSAAPSVTDPAPLRPSDQSAPAPAAPSRRPAAPENFRPAQPGLRPNGPGQPARPGTGTGPGPGTGPGGSWTSFRSPSASVAGASTPAVRPGVPSALRAAAGSDVRLVVLGTSTGGPEALNRVLPQLGAHVNVPILIVQHMPPVFTRLLAERLDRNCALTVIEAAGGEDLRPGHVYLAPGSSHLEIATGPNGLVTALSSAAPENFCRPAVDVLFRSAAATAGPGVLGVVLTGMGSDGCLGSRAIVGAGGSVIVQDEASSVVWGMPGAIAADGTASEVLSLAEIPGAVLRRLGAGATTGSTAGPNSMASVIPSGRP